jgi:hypothetical protein
MTKTEFSKITAAMNTYYPKEKPFPNAAAIQLWYEEFKELPYEDVVAALRRHVNVSRWCPTIAELKEAIVVNTAGDQDWAEAWKECLKAVHRFGQYQVEEGLNSLSPLTRRIAEDIGFKTLCVGDEEANRANFRMAYQQIANNEYQRAALPKSLRDQIALIGNGSAPLLEEEI